MRHVALAGLILLASPSFSMPQVVSKRVGQVTFVADLAQAYPGGLITVQLGSRRGVGTTYAILDGRRAPFYASDHGPRALVPIPSTATDGPATLGFEIFARNGRQRIPLDIAIAPRAYVARTVTIPETRRHLPTQSSAVRDSRRLLNLLRTETPAAHWRGPFRDPVAAAPVASFGAPETYVGGSSIEYLTDGIFGEQHRGLDYDVPLGTVVQAPAAGYVLFAGDLTVTGDTLVLDHGQGVISVFFHLSRTDVREGDRIEGRAPVALSGDSGVAYGPHLHWAVYVHGVAVDPRALEAAAN
jgi:hypothetical protein